jgi:hypothetical protein
VRVLCVCVCVCVVCVCVCVLLCMCVCLCLQCGVVKCSKGKEIPALLVCSNSKMHILRVTGEERCVLFFNCRALVTVTNNCTIRGKDAR